MKIKFNIENVSQKIVENKRNIKLTGWAFCGDKKVDDVRIYVNGEDIQAKYKEVSRKDVKKAYKNRLKDENTGFKLSFPLEDRIDVKSFKIEFIAGDIKQEIPLSQKRIKQIFHKCEIVYYIDNVISEGENGYDRRIIGWAYLTRYGEEVDFIVKDAEGNEIESEVTRIMRSDLGDIPELEGKDVKCGFELKYHSESEDTTVVMTDGENETKQVNIKKYLARNQRAYKKLVFKQIVTHTNLKNVKKAVSYVSHNGFKGLKEKMLTSFANENHYHDWFMRHKVTEEELEEQRNYKFEYNPKISIIVPTYNTPIKLLHEMVDSVRAQSYSNWELCIADGSQGNEELEKHLNEYAAMDKRIVVKYLDDNYGIAGNTNKALELATGDYIGLLDHDDLLTPNALFEVVKVLQNKETDIVYTDEDKVSDDLSLYLDPNFKPDFSIDLFRSHNYITHFFVCRKSIVDKIGGFRSEFDGSQDYDLMFRCIENAKVIEHIPMILYHWRITLGSVAENPAAKMYCYEHGKNAIQAHLDRMGIEAEVEMMDLWGMYRTRYATPGNPKVSIIIPNKDQVKILDTCIKSLMEVNDYENIEIVIVENNSTEKETFEYYDKIQKKYDCIKLVVWDGIFNYSAINNYGIKEAATGEYILLLNNDTEVIAKDAIRDMLGICMRKDVGIVGAKLLYEDNTIQHAGVVIGFGGYAGHVFNGLPKDDYGYMVRARINCNYSAVTAACLMVSREIFDEVGGLDEQFVVACNDVDFCLRVREKGYLVVYDAFALWYHYESKSRGYEDTPEKQARFDGEVKKFQDRWGDKILKTGDPYYNKNFPVTIAPFTLD